MENKNIFQKTIFVVIFAFICCSLWGSAFPCIKTGYAMMNVAGSDYQSQILFAGIRFFLAGILVIIFGSISGKKLMVPEKSALPKIFVLSMLQTVIQYMFFYMGMAHTAGAKGSIISGCGGFVTIIIACIFMSDEKMNKGKIIGCILGFAGLILVNLNGLEMSFEMNMNGEGFLLISMISASFSSMFIKIFSQKENPVLLSGYQFTLGGFIILCFGIGLGGHLEITGIGCILLIIYMALISSVAYTLWGILLKHNPVSKVAIFNFLIPVMGVILSGIILNEKIFSATTITALILVSIGIYAVNMEKEKSA